MEISKFWWDISLKYFVCFEKLILENGMQNLWIMQQARFIKCWLHTLHCTLSFTSLLSIIWRANYKQGITNNWNNKVYEQHRKTQTYPEQNIESKYHILQTAANLSGLPSNFPNCGHIGHCNSHSHSVKWLSLRCFVCIHLNSANLVHFIDFFIFWIETGL